MSDKETKFKAVSNIPSALYITCARDGSGKIDGFLASWVQQVSFDPLLISICIKSERLSYESIKNGGVFSMNVIGDNNKQIMKHFWSGYPEGETPFDKDVAYHESADGGIVINEAKATIICKAKEIYSPGDHNVVIAEVIDTVTSHADAETVIHKRKSAFDY